MRKLHCIYGACKSVSRKGLRGFDSAVRFFKFPNPCLEFRRSEYSKYKRNSLQIPESKLVNRFIKNHISKCKICDACQKWVVRCKRDDGKFSTISDIKKDTHICSKHFPSSTTTLDLFGHLPGQKKLKRKERKRSTLAVHEVELQEYDDTPPGPANEVLPTFDYGSNHLREGDIFSEVSQSQLLEEVIHTRVTHQLSRTSVQTFSRATQTVPVVKPKMSSKGTQTVLGLPCATQTTVSSTRINDIIQEIEILRKQKEAFYIENLFERFETQLIDDDGMCQFFCGFDYSQLRGIAKFFMDGKDIDRRVCSKNSRLTDTRNKLSPLQELILTMLRLRGGFLVDECQHLFGLSIDLISTTVTNWIKLMFTKFLALRTDMFLSREKIKENLPKRFRNMRNVRVIVDGIAIFCEVPSDLTQQTSCYSSYKGHTTFKFIIGVTPRGAVSFVSDLYEGSISDHELVIRSGLIDLLEEGDEILIDRGFTIKDLTDDKNVKLRIPSFLNGRQCLTPQEEMYTRIFAKYRIVAEHAVQRVKEFRFLQGVVPQSMRHVLSQAVYVCACLTNFQKEL